MLCHQFVGSIRGGWPEFGLFHDWQVLHLTIHRGTRGVDQASPGRVEADELKGGKKGPHCTPEIRRRILE
jgi:hypothetical protein